MSGYKETLIKKSTILKKNAISGNSTGYSTIQKQGLFNNIILIEKFLQNILFKFKQNSDA